MTLPGIMRRTPRLTRRDWLGDGVLTLLAGLALALSLALPWANLRLPGRQVSYALTKPDDINGALATPWGPPTATIAAAVVVLGLVMLALGTHRLAWLAGVLVVAGGAGAVAVAGDGARAALAWGYAPGLGVMLAMVVGILLVPIGVASTATALLLRRQARRPATGCPAASLRQGLANSRPPERWPTRR